MNRFISFSKTESGYLGAIDMDAIGQVDNFDRLVAKAEKKYSYYVSKMTQLLIKIEEKKKSKVLLPASYVWELGNLIFNLRDDLAKLSLEIDNLYFHICRDLNINRKRLEKMIILRRYVPNKQLLKGLNWGLFEKGTKKKVQEILLKRSAYGSR